MSGTSDSIDTHIFVVEVQTSLQNDGKTDEHNDTTSASSTPHPATKFQHRRTVKNARSLTIEDAVNQFMPWYADETIQMLKHPEESAGYEPPEPEHKMVHILIFDPSLPPTMCTQYRPAMAKADATADAPWSPNANEERIWRFGMEKMIEAADGAGRR